MSYNLVSKPPQNGSMKTHRRFVSGLLLPPSRLIIAYFLFGLAWLGANPLGAAPDERDHYIKALATAEGHPIGNRLTEVPGSSSSEIYVVSNARTFMLPYRLIPPADIACMAFHPSQSAACQDGVTYETRPGVGPQNSTEGSYQPYLYLLPGLFARAGWSFRAGFRLARLANLLTSIVLVALAAHMSWDPGRGSLSLVGLMVAVTPMSLFLFASANTSGPEVAGGICFTAGLLAFFGREKCPQWYVLAASVGGAVLVLGRATGVGFALLISATIAVLYDWNTIRLRLRSSGRFFFWGLALAFASMVAALSWEFTMHAHPASSPRLAISMLRPALHDLPLLFLEQVGVFGWLDTLMPTFVYSGWRVLVMMLVGSAFLLGSNRQRLGLLMMIASLLTADEFIDAVVLPPTGFGIQGRHTLPIAVAVPIAAAEIVRVNFPRVRMTGVIGVLSAISAVVAFMQAVAWYANARRYAVGVTGTWMFFKVGWRPAGGWLPWTALAGLGVVCLASLSWERGDKLAGYPAKNAQFQW